MKDELECPATPDDLYRSRGDEVEPLRPEFTGDVFSGVQIAGRSIDAMILQHPCALRNGPALLDRILVAEVTTYHKVSDWNGHTKVMPLPDLKQDGKHFAANFKEPWLVTPADLDNAERIAILSQRGVNLMLQRWVFHNSRATVETSAYNTATLGQFDEADLTEEWRQIRVDQGVDDDTAVIAEADEWFGGNHTTGESRRLALGNPQDRSSIQRDMKKHLKASAPAR